MNNSSDWIPNVHPLLVHFPIAILFLAMTIELFGFVLKKGQRYSSITDLLIWIGTLFAIITVLSGLQGAGSLHQLPADQLAAIKAHKITALMATGFFIGYSILRFYRYRYNGKLKPVAVILIFLLGCLGLLGIYRTGDKGARLVYKYSIGISKK